MPIKSMALFGTRPACLANDPMRLKQKQKRATDLMRHGGRAIANGDRQVNHSAAFLIRF
jgi:hypothetical protein